MLRQPQLDEGLGSIPGTSSIFLQKALRQLNQVPSESNPSNRTYSVPRESSLLACSQVRNHRKLVELQEKRLALCWQLAVLFAELSGSCQAPEQGVIATNRNIFSACEHPVKNTTQQQNYTARATYQNVHRKGSVVFKKKRASVIHIQLT